MLYMYTTVKIVLLIAYITKTTKQIISLSFGDLI